MASQSSLLGSAGDLRERLPSNNAHMQRFDIAGSIVVPRHRRKQRNLLLPSSYFMNCPCLNLRKGNRPLLTHLSEGTIGQEHETSGSRGDEQIMEGNTVFIVSEGKNLQGHKPSSNSVKRRRAPIKEYTSKRKEQFKEGLDNVDAPLDSATFISLLRNCNSLSDGKRIHAHITKNGLELGEYIGNLLITMYVKLGSLENARLVFNKMDQRNVVSWNIMVGAYARHRHGKCAFQLFGQMQQEGIRPNEITFLCILRACVSLAAIEEGKAIHARIVESGLDSNVVIGTALINMYGKCGDLKNAKAAFDKMHKRDVVSWTAIIAAYVQHGKDEEALQLFKEMQLEGVMPDKITYISVLGACTGLKALAEGKLIHARCIDHGWETDVVVGSALVNMYGKCGSIKEAYRAFDKIRGRNVVCWTAMITACAEHKHGREALQHFEQMQREGVKPDEIIFSIALDVCARLSALAEGKAIHASIVDSGINCDGVIGASLVNMYGKCGSLEEARSVFNKMHQRDLVSWTGMITAYAQHGHGTEALEVFKQMKQEGVKPDEITFVSVLSACSHAGLVDEGRRYFTSMTEDYGIVPTAEHFGCMIDLYGRAGQLDEAEDFVRTIPLQSNALAWKTLLGACRMHGDVERGKWAAERVIDLNPLDDAPYILLSNIYAADEHWDDLAEG